MGTLTIASSSSSLLPSSLDVVLHEGWCVKESGTAFLGKTNWRRRWFRLVQRKNTTILQYFRYNYRAIKLREGENERGRERGREGMYSCMCKQVLILVTSGYPHIVHCNIIKIIISTTNFN